MEDPVTSAEVSHAAELWCSGPFVEITRPSALAGFIDPSKEMWKPQKSADFASHRPVAYISVHTRERWSMSRRVMDCSSFHSGEPPGATAIQRDLELFGKPLEPEGIAVLDDRQRLSMAINRLVAASRIEEELNMFAVCSADASLMARTQLGKDFIE
ncbi:hypothetical protein P7K49_013469 [Saguinus oedipus]|uniref:Uncharacterized protein n=1 Tax=Saguinus oedipus TaxID=9490 RepID=A0ABQ9VG19_SAGOE|nr:hypothetical protein P7K49_013469 [Saguinus oedipus]